MLTFFKTTAYLTIAVLLAGAAILIPAQLRSVDPAVLRAAGDGGRAVSQVWEEGVRSARIGPTLRLLDATNAGQDDARAVRTQIEALVDERPSLLRTGGSDRALEDFLELVQAEPNQNSREEVRVQPLLPQLLPRSERASLSGMLAASSDANVRALLSARNLRGLTRLHPAGHAAGAPYDAGILTLALLSEGGHFTPTLARQIGQIASRAAAGQLPAVRSLESLVIATLSLGRQLDHRSLADLAANSADPDDWTQMATLFRAQPDRINQLYAALIFQGAPQPVFDYLSQFPESANADLDEALRNGPKATRQILEATLPVHRPKGATAHILDRIDDLRPPQFIDLSLHNRQAALGLKALLFLLSGFIGALALGTVRPANAADSEPLSWFSLSVLARNFFISLFIALFLWTIFEPKILKSKQSEAVPDTGPRIEFLVADTLQSLKSPVKAMQELNQVTLLVLALFFIVQLVIYCFCLIKLKEIGKQNVSPNLKIRLLENEENLFDFGLYVGLGGTVLSLILVAIGIVEASLMAAYASTLFGILFVALLKVLHLRPYRRRLIIESESEPTGPMT